MDDAIGKSIYLDRGQCDRFEVSYRKDGEVIVIAASTLLKSKDYDTAHKDILGPLKSKTIVAERKPENGPGWFTITRVI